jgi:TRAP-type C4-dicarboxylate transport system substrate-binding protein
MQMKERQSKKLLFVMVALVLALVMLLTALGACKSTPVTTTETATTTVKPVTLIFQSFDPEDSIWGNVLVPWFNELEKQSGGKIIVETHWNGELVPLPEIYDAVVKGTLDIATQLTTFPAGSFPMEEIGAFTSLNVQIANYSKVAWELHKGFPEMQAAFKSAKVISMLNSWPNPLCTSKKYGPVTTLEQNKGLKEVGFGDWQVQLGAALGRTSVSLMPADTYSAFEKGVADGMQCSITLLRTNKFGEVLPNVTLMAGTLGPWSLLMNLNKFNALPADVQQYINASGDKLADQFDAECLKEYNADLAAFPKQFGTNFVTIPTSEIAKWETVRQPVFDKYVKDLEAKGLPGTKLMAEWQRLEKQYTIK